MRKLPTLILYVQHTLHILILVCSLDARGVEILLKNDVHGDYSLDRVNLTASELNESMTDIDVGGPQLGKHTHIEIELMNNLYFWYSCEHDRNTAGEAFDIKHRDMSDPIRLEYVRQAADHINNCSSWSVIQENGTPTSDDFSVYRIFIFYEDRYNPLNPIQGTFHKNLFGTIEHSPSCNALVRDNINFGEIPPKGSAEAQGKLTIKCDFATNITVRVNDGTPMLSTDGAEIAFVYDGNLMVPGSQPIDVIITADMNQTPSQPGSYQWAVPVKITYE
ncbi:hypothetical protein ACOA7M_001057 [Vibrio cholerae]